jgi:hypothetical protein
VGLTGNITAHLSVRELLCARVALVHAAKLNQNAQTDVRGELPLVGICRSSDSEVGWRLRPVLFFASYAAVCRAARVCLSRQRARRRRVLRKLKHGQRRDGVLAVSDERCVQEWHMFHIRGYVTRVRSVWLGNPGRSPWV